MKVIICGSERWPYKEIVKDEIARLKREAGRLHERLLIIHGWVEVYNADNHFYHRQNNQQFALVIIYSIEDIILIDIHILYEITEHMKWS